MKASKIVCSFCHASETEVKQIVADPTGTVFICDECIRLCYSVVDKESTPVDEESNPVT